MHGASALVATARTSIPAILRAWRLAPLPLAGIGSAGLLYGTGLREARRRSQARPKGAGYFFAGLGVLVVALVSPIDGYSDSLLSVHMVQHLLLTMVAPPLLLLGAPVTLALRISSPRTRRRFLLPVLQSRVVHLLSNPLVGWGLFAGVLWGSHFTGLYELSLENAGVHDLEHALYLSSALLFWSPVVAVDPAPTRLSHPARLLYLFLSMPMMALLGLAVYSSDRLLYPHYAVASAALGVSPVGDQHLAGALMWGAGMFVIVPALGGVLWQWLEKEDRRGARLDEALAAGKPAGPAGDRPPG